MALDVEDTMGRGEDKMVPKIVTAVALVLEVATKFCFTFLFKILVWVFLRIDLIDYSSPSLKLMCRLRAITVALV